MIGNAIINSLLVLFIGIGSLQNNSTNSSIEGVWKITEVQTVKPDGQISSIKPLESQVLFTKGYYSFCWTSHKSFTKTWQIADTERVARFNQTLINAGTYTISDSLLITYAEFAMSPKFVGGSATFRYKMSGDSLFLIGRNVLSADGMLHPIYTSGAHIVNKLVRIK